MGKLTKSLKNSIWYSSKISNGTRYAEQNWEVRGTPCGEGVIASVIIFLKLNEFSSREVQIRRLCFKLL